MHANRKYLNVLEVTLRNSVGSVWSTCGIIISPYQLNRRERQQKKYKHYQLNASVCSLHTRGLVF